MKFFALLCWVLLLSWLTHAAASPTWRTPVITEELLSEEQALNKTVWIMSKQATWESPNTDNAIQIRKEGARWAKVTRDVSIPENTDLLRVRASLKTEVPMWDRLTLNPQPVLHLRLNQGARLYPLVERPLFFRRSVVVDEVLELVGKHEVIEIALISAENSNWQLSGVSIASVQEHARYTSAYTALLALWGLTLIWGVVKAWQRSKLPTALVGLTLGLVLMGVLASRTKIVLGFNYMVSWVQSLGGGLSSKEFTRFMEAGHLGIFAVLTVLVLWFRARWRLTFSQVLAGLVVLAVATEALQRHVVGRSPDVQDFIFDLFGMLLGTLIYVCAKKILSR